MKYTIYIGTNSMRDSQGIYRLSLDGDSLELRVESSTPCFNGDYLALSPDGGALYAGHEVVYIDGKAAAAASAYRVEADGSLCFLNRQSVDGQMNCYVSVSRDGRRLYSASYMAGSVTVHPIGDDGTLGPYTQALRQPPREGMHWPSAHSVLETPDGRYAVVTNVGLDSVFLYDTGDWHCACEMPVPGRPRQSAFSGDGRFLYVSTESGGEVFVFRYAPEEERLLAPVQRVSTVTPGFRGHAETAGIKLSPDGRLLLVSNRAEAMNDLALFRVDAQSGALTPMGRVPVGGIFPRDFDFSPDGRFLLVGLQFSDQLELFAVEEDRFTSRGLFPLPCCSCVKFAEG